VTSARISVAKEDEKNCNASQISIIEEKNSFNGGYETE